MSTLIPQVEGGKTLYSSLGFFMWFLLLKTCHARPTRHKDHPITSGDTLFDLFQVCHASTRLQPVNINVHSSAPAMVKTAH